MLLIWIMQVHCPDDYRAWLQSMYTLFGTKWAKLYCGPLLSYAPIMQAPDTGPASTDTLHPTKVSIALNCYQLIKCMSVLKLHVCD